MRVSCPALSVVAFFLVHLIFFGPQCVCVFVSFMFLAQVMIREIKWPLTGDKTERISRQIWGGNLGDRRKEL